MCRARGRPLARLCVLAISLVSLYVAAASATVCDPHSLYDCGEHERCVQVNQTGTCQCERDFIRVNGLCKSLPPTERSVMTSAHPTADEKANSGGASVAAGLLIPTFLILLAAATYYGARRYKWVQRFRQFRQNRYGNVLVTRDETDDDDPPIA